MAAAAAAAASLQSCLTLWDPIDGSPPGSPVPVAWCHPTISSSVEFAWNISYYCYCSYSTNNFCQCSSGSATLFFHQSAYCFASCGARFHLHFHKISLASRWWTGENLSYSLFDEEVRKLTDLGLHLKLFSFLPTYFWQRFIPWSNSSQAPLSPAFHWVSILTLNKHKHLS